MIVIGIDPGLTGALAAIYPDRRCALVDMPCRPMEVSGMGANRVDVRALVGELRRLVPADQTARVVIERVGIQRTGGNAIQTVGSLCATVALIVAAVVDVQRWPLETVEAATWTRRFGLRRQPGETDAAWKARHRAMALQLYPAADITLAKHHGRADALLIAHDALERLV